MTIQNRVLAFIIIITKLNTALAPHHLNQMIIRNVGQGQWITHLTNDYCDHYDFGGELAWLRKQKKQFTQLCSKKINRLYLSHADKDHYAFLPFIQQKSTALCWQYQAIDAVPFFQKLPFCNLHSKARLIYYNPRNKNKNDRSLIFNLGNFLLPGDASTKTENDWPLLSKIEILVLGHHGSKSSTGHRLLKSLPELKIAVSSARYARFRHPHQETLLRLKKYHIPILTTEEWGNIIFDSSY